jgi:RimJ/RimL family protein N-acetyltransferase
MGTKEKVMLRLRPFRSPDAKTIITWTSEPEEFYKWSAGIMGDYPVSEKIFLENVSARVDNTRYFPFVAFDESGLVGFFSVRTPGEDDRKVRFGFVIVDPMKRGHGYGSRMLRLGLKYAFEIYGANEVSLGVFDNNMAAYHCYKSVGFKETGDRIVYKICGEDWTDIEMEISSHPQDLQT